MRLMTRVQGAFTPGAVVVRAQHRQVPRPYGITYRTWATASGRAADKFWGPDNPWHPRWDG